MHRGTRSDIQENTVWNRSVKQPYHSSLWQQELAEKTEFCEYGSSKTQGRPPVLHPILCVVMLTQGVSFTRLLVEEFQILTVRLKSTRKKPSKRLNHPILITEINRDYAQWTDVFTSNGHELQKHFQQSLFFLWSGIWFSGGKPRTSDILPHYLKNNFIYSLTPILFQKWAV